MGSEDIQAIQPCQLKILLKKQWERAKTKATAINIVEIFCIIATAVITTINIIIFHAMLNPSQKLI
jgi:hypothetical protein